MSHHTFYDPHLSAEQSGDVVALTGPEGRHGAHVRRVRVGEVIDVVDGRGTRARLEVTTVGKDHLEGQAVSVTTEERTGPSITLVQALAKGGRDEAAIEAATELGVDTVIAWESSRSVSRWKGDKVAKGQQRWEAILVAAMKQSRRCHVPVMRGYARGEQVLEKIPADATVLVLHETAADNISAVELPTSGEVVLVVGPEGGLTDDEVALLTGTACRHAVVLGPEVLRTSTAGPAAIAVLNTRLGRW